MKKWIVPAVVVCLVLVVGYLSTLSITVPGAPKPDRQAQVDRLEEETDRAVKGYKANTDKLTDLSVLAEPIIKGLPGVEKITVTGNPGKRLIHILDWHFVDRDDFKIDMEQAHKRKLSKDEVDEMYRDHLQVIEMVQIEQMGLIQCLRHHGIRSIYSEGYAIGEEKGFSQKVSALVGIQEQYKETRRQLSDVRDIMKDPGRKKQAQDLEKEVLSASADLKPLLEFGSAGRLLLKGQLHQVLPMEDKKAGWKDRRGSREDREATGSGCRERLCEGLTRRYHSRRFSRPH